MQRFNGNMYSGFEVLLVGCILVIIERSLSYHVGTLHELYYIPLIAPQGPQIPLVIPLT